MNAHQDIEKDLHGPERQFAITSWAVKNRTTVIVLTVLIFLMGIYSYQVMPKESFPEVVTPEIFVSTPYNSSSVVDIEKLITKPLEKEINTISGVDEIKSTSVPNYSAIDVKFNYNITPEQALRKVKDAVDKARGDRNFPTDLPSRAQRVRAEFQRAHAGDEHQPQRRLPHGAAPRLRQAPGGAHRGTARDQQAWRSAACPNAK
jgi:hypothetical protein